MKTTLATIAAAVLVAGCITTPAELTDNPQHTFKSTKSAKDVAICVSGVWSKHTTPNTNMLPNGYSVVLPNQLALADAAATMTDVPGGSVVTYSRRKLLGAPEWMLGAVTGCI